ncbi:hypothetical protein F2Q70_00044414 [Brassica cretica]|uniref:Uncharacterized protein n=1 Tax=Brassica cretica TaxID=69181 RepID=A0A8S9KJQ1_BRACR|nr:hypothetical protein F2Q70_00044414 [Brassica cretica]KAF2598504.1 hypothetical protein F2Q68_00008043 [Brassica cretica]
MWKKAESSPLSLSLSNVINDLLCFIHLHLNETQDQGRMFSLEVKHLVGTLLYMDHSGDPASFHAAVAKTCFELKNQLITASYVDDETSM